MKKPCATKQNRQGAAGQPPPRGAGPILAAHLLQAGAADPFNGSFHVSHNQNPGKGKSQP